MQTCAWCKQSITEGEPHLITEGERVLALHDSCFKDLALLVRETVRTTTSLGIPVRGLNRLIRDVGGRRILVHRSFPNEQLPALAYLGIMNQPVPVTDVYSWLLENEVRIKNPANQILRLKEKGLVATFD